VDNWLWKRLKGLAIGIALSVLSIFVTFCAGETSLRLYLQLRYGFPFFAELDEAGIPLSQITLDHYLGWRATENYRVVGTMKSADGTEYSVKFSHNEYGFRMFSNLHSGRPRVLVVGDSVTDAREVSDDKTYYAITKNFLGVEMFAYGGGGYGTLQEYMILDKYIDLIRPTLILWQYCSNDFINNSPELETASNGNNNGMIRPYWMSGRVVYILPKRSGLPIRRFALQYSRFLYFVISRLDKTLASITGQSVEDEIARLGFEHRGFLNSVKVTDELMSKVRSRAGNMPIVAFSCDDLQPYTDAFKEISSNHSITFLEDVASSIRGAERGGTVVKAKDKAHWNEAGHRIAGEVISTYLRKIDLHSGLK